MVFLIFMLPGSANISNPLLSNIHARFYFRFNVPLLYFYSHMLTEPKLPADFLTEPKRQRNFPNDFQELTNVPRKRQPKNTPDQLNPYENIPELPHVKLSQDDMNGDPIDLFIRLEEKFKEYGAVKVTANQHWRCPYQQRFVDKGITTRIQHLSKLKHGKVNNIFGMRQHRMKDFAFEQNVQSYSFHSYQSYAMNFEKTYKYRTQPKGNTSQSKKEAQYWSLVSKPQYEKSNVKVEYAADLASTKYGSGFPNQTDSQNSDQHFCYGTNLYNLNNIMNSPSSVLSMTAERKEKVSGITHPWVYMGSMFSSFCWHVEDLGVNSLNYNHKGGTKTWYVVPSAYKSKFDTFVKNKYCLNSHKKSLLERITFMVDPLELIEAGIPVYKAYQRPHDYICTFFSAYHCGFSQGYNVGQAVNFLSPLSIEVMKKAERQKKLNPKSPPNVIPIDWIVYENYVRIKQFKQYGQKIKEAYWEMINQQKKEIDQIKNQHQVTKIRVFSGLKKYDKIYCSTCKEYLYLRAYKVSDKKTYCAEHLDKQEQSNSKVTILLRKPNDDRKYILSAFGKIPIEEEQDDNEVKKSSKSVPKSSYRA